MRKYIGKQLRKGSRVIDVLCYIAPGINAHRSPSGERRGMYGCLVNGKTRFIYTHNVSRYVKMYGYHIVGDECFLHAQYAIKHQENVQEKEFGMWRKFLNLFK